METFRAELVVLRSLFRGIAPGEQREAVGLLRSLVGDCHSAVRERIAQDAIATVQSIAENMIQVKKKKVVSMPAVLNAV